MGEGYKELFTKVGTQVERLNYLASESNDDRQKFVEEREENGSMTWRNFINELASPLGNDEDKAMKEGIKNLSELLLNSIEDGIPVNKVKFPASQTMEVNAFTKKADVFPFIYHPVTKSFRFHYVFVERAARKWKKERKVW